MLTIGNFYKLTSLRYKSDPVGIAGIFKYMGENEHGYAFKPILINKDWKRTFDEPATYTISIEHWKIELMG